MLQMFTSQAHVHKRTLITNMLCYTSDYIAQITQEALNAPPPPVALSVATLMHYEKPLLTSHHLLIRPQYHLLLAV